MTLALYWQTGGFELTGFDDDIYIRDNPHVLAGLSMDGFIWAFTTNHDANWFPLTWLTHMLDVELYGDDYGKHHVTNVVLHIANAILLFVLLQRSTREIWASAFVAALFAIHPMHVESVAWLAERKDVLSMFFGLLAMLAYVQYVHERRLFHYMLTFTFLALGLMAKPMLVTLPFLLLLMDYWPLGRLPLPARPVSRLWPLLREKLPLFGLIVASSIITYSVQNTGGSVSSLEKVALDLRIENSLIAYVTYIYKVIWPFDLAAHYPFSVESLSASKAGLAALFLAGATVAALRHTKRLPYLIVGWFWFIGTLVPVIGLVHLGEQAMADRYSYLSYVGLFVILSWGAIDLMGHWRHGPRALMALSIVILLTLLPITWKQISHWRNGITIFSHALDATPNNTLAHYNLANNLMDAGREDEALRHYAAVLRDKPGHLQTSLNLGNIAFERGEIVRAIAYYRTAVLAPVTPKDVAAIADAHNNLGYALFSQGDLKMARYHYERALSLMLGHDEALKNIREMDMSKQLPETLRSRTLETGS